jgi:hypothetical protein
MPNDSSRCRHSGEGLESTRGLARLRRSGLAMFENDDPAKRAAGFAAVDRYVRDGMCVGLGTGTTAYWAIERVGQRVANGERITAVATSSETERLCRRLLRSTVRTKWRRTGR